MKIPEYHRVFHKIPDFLNKSKEYFISEYSRKVQTICGFQNNLEYFETLLNIPKTPRIFPKIHEHYRIERRKFKKSPKDSRTL